MKKEEKGEFRDFTDGSSDGKREYKNKVVFLRKSKKGKHLYAFNNEGALDNAESILMNVSEVQALIAGEFESIKVSIMEKKEPNDDLSEK
jgi:hypothetical protein